jgi:undecaprenyl-diphosphatase
MNPAMNPATNPHAFILATFAILLAWSVASPRGAALDAALFSAINGRPLPMPVEALVRLASHFGLLPTNVLIWAAVWLALDRRAAVTGGAGLLAAWSACRLLKAVIARSRPYLAVPGARLVGLEPSGSSFPSSHAALAVYTAVVASHSLGFGPVRTVLAYSLAALVCYARVYLGAHYPRDVLAGAVIGLAAALGALALGDGTGIGRRLPSFLRRYG